MRSMHREACTLGECLALPRRCQQQLATAGAVPERLAALPMNGAFVKGGGEATREATINAPKIRTRCPGPLVWNRNSPAPLSFIPVFITDILK